MSNAQGLPMTTIALVIVVLLTVAGLAFFFFTQFGVEESGVGAAQCQRECKSVQVAVQSSGANTDNKIGGLNKAEGYCKKCHDQTCNIERANGTSCDLDPCNSTGCYGCN